MLTLFFDLDGTLLDHSVSEQKAALALYDVVRPEGMTAEAFSDLWHRTQQKYFERYLTGAISYLDQRRARMREVVGEHIPDKAVDDLFDIYLAAYEKHWRIYPDVRPCLARIESIKVGLITNGDFDQQWRKLRRLGLENRFDPVIISGAFGSAKPEAGIFREACERAGSAPERTVYVGDRVDVDARGARDAGLVGVWLNRGAEANPDPEVHEIGSLESLPDLMERIAEASSR